LKDKFPREFEKLDIIIVTKNHLEIPSDCSENCTHNHNHNLNPNPREYLVDTFFRTLYNQSKPKKAELADE